MTNFFLLRFLSAWPPHAKEIKKETDGEGSKNVKSSVWTQLNIDH